MIDLHAHVLPGLDDGPADSAGALDLLEAMVRDGTSTVVASPHGVGSRYGVSGPQVLEAVRKLQDAARAAGLKVRILPGMELPLRADLVRLLRRGDALSIAGTRYVCVELPHQDLPWFTERALFELAVAGYVPVINHPERNRAIQERPDRLARMAERGVLAMLSAGSLLGDFGRTAQRLAERFLKEGSATLVASDAHGLRTRPPALAAALERAAALGKTDQLAEMEILQELASTGLTAR
ncbi:tyrosine-protein phosphatase [Caldinitratiruptor microaerophilus]|uniref:protein-tyrosine-phosphatase n=1 Tax=Caldinitratiruptor microaerophilus TaxID=671077 RepID=A0AA35G7D0_9FIRM|nr:CpsB/CapC family capsule biosynthesis tyrosine phosphatase [Caldinitratiruptor microaerophilus]BDG59720.1 hypothetical protein caldi_08100 [Caldinitratiruptor microaerophilus]